MTDEAAPAAPPPAPGTPRAGGGAALIRIEHVSKRYGLTKALDDVSLDVRTGEIVGLIGHNGAGKSTLMRVLAGITGPDQGRVTSPGHGGGSISFSPRTARGLGIRIVFQELSLCPDLSVFENVLITNASLSGARWRRRARALIQRQLDIVFPGHGISPWSKVEQLPLAHRQMVEIARATLDVGDPRLIILDEPTSALDHDAVDGLFDFVRRQQQQGMSFVLISHRIPEILQYTDRVVVMRDGRIAGIRSAVEVSEDDLVEMMGGVAGAQRVVSPDSMHPAEGRQQESEEKVVSTVDYQSRYVGPVTVHAARGEIVGLSGLEGHGQRELLFDLWRRRSSRAGRSGIHISGKCAFVTGDRQEGGLFPLWNLALNISISAIHTISHFGAISVRDERGLAASWIDRLKVRGTAMMSVGGLSGGNQQKVLIARALASGADIVLLDDPFRGVDIGTRQDAYRLIRREVETQSTTFLWFSTENRELQQCDRVYVFSEGRVAAELVGSEITEEAIVAASFSSHPADGPQDLLPHEDR